jgi:anti-sigma regulatory factor (Ser/Thr protein kinase)
LSADQVTLRLPRERSFFSVASLVVGGFAVRLNLSFEQLEDLQVAVGELLEQHESDEEITISVQIVEGVMEVQLGPFDETLTKELTRGDGAEVGLRRVLDTVMDGVELTERDGRPWVELRKRVEADA